MVRAIRRSVALTGVQLVRMQNLEAQTAKYLGLAEAEERDKSPIYLAPAIGVYTR